MKKAFKVVLVLSAIALTAVIAVFAAYLAITKDAKLDESKLTDYGRCITVCDKDGKEITNASLSAKRKSVRLADLKDYTVNAFIASEDRMFYKHSGLNYKRMVKALITNIGSRSFRQGASTISQQLIKNTHLTGDKTISRKLKEIKLTRALEKKYPKDEILEMYLNTIYFGHNCYGLESAAQFYFGTTANNLDLAESATLAGLLSSPNNYSPFKDGEKCLERRNIVLGAMKNCGFIEKSEYDEAVKSCLPQQVGRRAGGNSDYLSAVFEELENIFPAADLVIEGCKIITFMDADLQKIVEAKTETDAACIVTSVDGGVKAYRSDIGRARRQPGSTIKPLLVYAPAIEEKLISPATKIADEPINFGGYCPENHDKKYHGYITAEEALAKSYNIPAVKTLNSLTIDKAEKYAHRLGIKLENEEKNLSLALGGMKYGTDLQKLCEMYRAFPRGGNYTATRFIKEIKLNNGKTIYRSQKREQGAFSQGTASLINGMLEKSVEYGTAKKLAGKNYDLAAKTGTCGTEKGNTDAYCICYTGEDCLAVWLGSAENKPLNVTGGKDCTKLASDILSELYKDHNPLPLEKNKGTEDILIDRAEYNDKGRFVLAEDIAPKISTKQIKVLSGNIPKERSARFSSPEIKKPTISTKNDTVFIKLCHAEYYAYSIKRKNGTREEIIYDGVWKECIEDKVDSGKYTYTVTPYYLYQGRKFYGKEVTLPAISLEGKLSPQSETPDIAKRDWFNE